MNQTSCFRHGPASHPGRTLLSSSAVWIVSFLLSACSGGGNDPSAPALPPDAPSPEPLTAPAGYAGRDYCIECHEKEGNAWLGSDHDLAMQTVSAETVLGDFDDATHTHYGVTSRFFRRDQEFVVRTEGPDGQLTDYEVAYVFGVRPLQQYLVEFPDGRVQTLPLCWDTRPESQGGQRWFHIYPDEVIPPGDVLHWTGLAQNWNYMCAECHSTRVRKGYRPEEDRFQTTFAEINVSCEACHGPGSHHVAWARKLQGASPGATTESARRAGGDMGLAVRLKDADGGAWAIDPETGTAKRTVPRSSRVEIEMCARCHSRRTLISEDYTHGGPLLDTHRVALLSDVLYHPDGQILEEVYVYGSFLQSRMYHAGVTCTDCHDPHSGRTLADDNALCASCHLPSKFDTPSHHFHKADSIGASCVECHMPESHYMVVDPRRDHSLRIPRPDLSITLGTPNACNRCHDDRSPQWSLDAVEEWYGPNRRNEPHWGEAIQAGRKWEAGAGERLLQVVQDESVPGIARATALTLLFRYVGADQSPVFVNALRDEDPLIRFAALGAMDAMEPISRLRALYHVLSDSVRVVRTEAARCLSTVPPALLSSGQRAKLDEVLNEYRAEQVLNGDRAEAHLNLGVLHLSRGEPFEAKLEFERAIEIMPSFAPAWVDLADFYRTRDRDDEGERVLREALLLIPDNADLHHSLGLLLVRQKRLPAALQEFRRAAELVPDLPHFQYVLAVALNSSGDMEGARQVLAGAHDRFPGNAAIGAFLRQFPE